MSSSSQPTEAGETGFICSPLQIQGTKTVRDLPKGTWAVCHLPPGHVFSLLPLKMVLQVCEGGCRERDSSLLCLADVGLRRWERKPRPSTALSNYGPLGLRTLVREWQAWLGWGPSSEIRALTLPLPAVARGLWATGQPPPSRGHPQWFMYTASYTRIPPTPPLGVGTSAAVLCPKLSESLSSQTPFFF